MLTVPKGTIENVVVYIDDALEALTDLTDKSPEFEVFHEFDTATSVIGWTPCEAGPTLMSVLCLVDTTTFVPGKYDMYVKLDNIPERPVVGPMTFKVE